MCACSRRLTRLTSLITYLLCIDTLISHFRPFAYNFRLTSDPGSKSKLLSFNMHELFLTSHVANDDLSRTVRILQGYCGMKPVFLLQRRLMWEGPRMRTNLKGIDPGFVMRQSPPMVQAAWKALHDQLVRQSYIMTLVYDVNPDDFGKVAANGSEEKP